MPSNYKRTLKQQSWNAVGMLNAIDSVKYINVSYSEATKWVPRRVQNINIEATCTFNNNIIF